MILELKYLAPYLPYKLKFEHPTLLVRKKEISTLKNLGQTHIEIKHRQFVQISDCKPILKPISDLEKLIENEFSKLDDFKGLEYTSEIIELFCFENIGFEEELSVYNLNKLPYECVEFMFRNHYDFFGLINQKLAISIHDVE